MENGGILILIPIASKILGKIIIKRIAEELNKNAYGKNKLDLEKEGVQQKKFLF